jgi:hypothetical protein
MAVISFSEKPIDVKLKFDTGKRVEGNYGDQYMWGCNGDDVFYATPTLNAMIMMLGVKAEDTLSINKQFKVADDGKKIPYFLVNGKSMDDLKQGQKDKEHDQNHKEAVDMVKNVFGDASEEPKTSNVDKRLDDLESRVSKLENNNNPSDDEVPF